MIRLWLLAMLAVARAAWRTLKVPDDDPRQRGARGRSR